LNVYSLTSLTGRSFGGLSIEETTDELSISAATVERSWDSARG